MNRLISCFRNRNFIFSLAIFCGLFLGKWAAVTKWAVLPALAIVMTVSTLGIPGEFFRVNRSMTLPILTGLLMNFVVQAGVLIGLGRVLISDEMLWTGIVLVASVPPAVAVIPFTGLLGGDTAFSLMATIGGYLGGLVITPLICLTFLGTTIIDPVKVLIILGQLVIAPIVASRILIFLGADRPILPHKGTITNWGFFVVIYTIIGLNRKVFFNDLDVIAPLLVVCLSSTFLLGALTDFVSGRLGLDPARRISIKLLGTLKNAGTAAGIALVLFGKKAALPAAIVTTFMIIYFMWLSMRKHLGDKRREPS